MELKTLYLTPFQCSAFLVAASACCQKLMVIEIASQNEL